MTLLKLPIYVLTLTAKVHEEFAKYTRKKRNKPIPSELCENLGVLSGEKENGIIKILSRLLIS